ncbi:MAG: hypothetical protein RMJ39_10055 [Deltaproteobacteria bacterium]|nr:hypothetical protein [Candidatus Aenigmarchaeota archaeon]MDW8002981.1 hypothetical protein [Deltaproteobacteria bacterium]
MKKIAVIIVVLMVGVMLLSEFSIASEQKKHLVDFLKEDKIEIKVHGRDIESIVVSLRRKVPYRLIVLIPAGTYFVSTDRSVQNMVATKGEEVTLDTDSWKTLVIEAACANMHKDVPSSQHNFTVQYSPTQKELEKLIPILEMAKAPFPVRQAAIWIVTDNADFEELGTLRSGIGGFGPRVIDEEVAAKAMQICEKAGIDITRKAIWRDRHTILKGLKAGELRTWLEQKIEKF